MRRCRVSVSLHSAECGYPARCWTQAVLDAGLVLRVKGLLLAPGQPAEVSGLPTSRGSALSHVRAAMQRQRFVHCSKCPALLQVLVAALYSASDLALRGLAHAMAAYVSGGGLPLVVRYMSHTDAKVSPGHVNAAQHAVRCLRCCNAPPHTSTARLLQVRVAAVLAVGNFACECTAFRDAVIRAGAVDKLVQVRPYHWWHCG